MKVRVEAWGDREVVVPDNYYQGLAEVHSGVAGTDIIKGCIVSEGGAFRATYNFGALDAMMEESFCLEAIVGISAGALSGVNYASGQIGRSARLSLGFRHDRRYVGANLRRTDGGIIGFNFIFQKFNEFEPLDEKALNHPGKRLVAAATSLETGKLEYFENGKCNDYFGGLKASASMQYVSRPVMVNGRPYLDGGCSDRIPIQWALDQGYDKIVVVRTRSRDYRKEPISNGVKHMNAAFYRRYPEFLNALNHRDERYNEICDQLDQMEREGKIFVLAPSEMVHVGPLEKDMEKLGDLYWKGYNETRARVGELKEYLGVS